jgi:hypothetical protein
VAAAGSSREQGQRSGGLSCGCSKGPPWCYSHLLFFQQNCSEEEAIVFWGDVQTTIDSAVGGATKVLTMDVNASVGIQRPTGDVPVCGACGLERVSPAGERLKDWSSQNGLHAVSTHFRPPADGHGFGTWKHPRNHNLHQNGHVFVSRASLQVVKSCRNFSPLVVSDV